MLIIVVNVIRKHITLHKFKMHHKSILDLNCHRKFIEKNFIPQKALTKISQISSFIISCSCRHTLQSSMQHSSQLFMKNIFSKINLTWLSHFYKKKIGSFEVCSFSLKLFQNKISTLIVLKHNAVKYYCTKLNIIVILSINIFDMYRTNS